MFCFKISETKTSIDMLYTSPFNYLKGAYCRHRPAVNVKFFVTLDTILQELKQLDNTEVGRPLVSCTNRFRPWQNKSCQKTTRLADRQASQNSSQSYFNFNVNVTRSKITVPCERCWHQQFAALHMCNMKALSLLVRKLWPRLQFFEIRSNCKVTVTR